MKNKSNAQMQAYGRAAGKDLDSCFHRACDTISNTNADLLKEMSAALAYATAIYALAPRG